MNIYLSTFRSDKTGCFSDVMIDGYLYKSIEQPDRNNKPFESCVPEGEYDLIKFNSPKYGRCFLLSNPELNVYPFKEDRKNETDRYLCIFAHKGSYPEDFQGCIGLGNKYIESLSMITNTKKTCKKVMNMLYSMDEPHKLIINRTGYAD